jgi:hypothetical protein
MLEIKLQQLIKLNESSKHTPVKQLVIRKVINYITKVISSESELISVCFNY